MEQIKTISLIQALSCKKQNFYLSAFRLLALYWKGEEKRFAWYSLVALVMLSLMAVVIALLINEWYKHFYNSIQDRDAYSFFRLIFLFVGVLAFSVLRSALITYCVDVFALKWRRWLTHYYLSAWVVELRQPVCLLNHVDNPDQRIAEDIKKFTFETVDLACGLLYTLASIVSFSIVLVGISGDAALWGVSVPAYMFWAVLVYAVLGSLASQKIGYKLVSLSSSQQCSEANFRYCLMHFRDRCSERNNSFDRITEKDIISEKLDLSLLIIRRIIRVKVRLSIFTESYRKMALIVSSLLAVPRYFSGEITFGDVMQINSAFGNLCGNLSWYINAFRRLADWKATTDRLIYFDHYLLAERYHTGQVGASMHD